MQSPVRTAIGTYAGSLKDVAVPALGAAVIRATLERAGIGAGLPVEVPALTVNRVCGSGAQGIVSTALEVGAGLRKVGSPASEALLVEGEPAEQIARTAQTHDHSLILVGKHGQNWVEGRLIGSTAVRICEIAGRPVLVMP